jgi:uncharacterized membrane protein YkoI
MTEGGRHRAGSAGRLAAALAVSALAFATPAWAGEDHNTARALRESGTIVPLEKVVAAASREHDGHLLQVELERRGGIYVYEVEFVDPEGVVWKMYFDARDGSLLERDREND